MAEVDGVEPMENGTGPDEEGEQVKCDIILDKGTADDGGAGEEGAVADGVPAENGVAEGGADEEKTEDQVPEIVEDQQMASSMEGIEEIPTVDEPPSADQLEAPPAEEGGEAGAEEPAAEEAQPSEEPPPEEPPVEEIPVEEAAPADEPPPEEAPPPEEPPAEEEAPPAEEVPVEEPLPEETPAEEPPAEEAPPPEEAPPEEPPAEEGFSHEEKEAIATDDLLIDLDVKTEGELQAEPPPIHISEPEAQEGAVSVEVIEPEETPPEEPEPEPEAPPAEEAAVEEPPAEEAPPPEEPPVEEVAPVEEAPVEEAPVEEAPIEPPPTEDEVPSEQLEPAPEPEPEPEPAKEPTPPAEETPESSVPSSPSKKSKSKSKSPSKSPTKKKKKTRFNAEEEEAKEEVVATEEAVPEEPPAEEAPPDEPPAEEGGEDDLLKRPAHLTMQIDEPMEDAESAPADADDYREVPVGAEPPEEDVQYRDVPIGEAPPEGEEKAPKASEIDVSYNDTEVVTRREPRRERSPSPVRRREAPERVAPAPEPTREYRSYDKDSHREAVPARMPSYTTFSSWMPAESTKYSYTPYSPWASDPSHRYRNEYTTGYGYRPNLPYVSQFDDMMSTGPFGRNMYSTERFLQRSRSRSRERASALRSSRSSSLYHRAASAFLPPTRRRDYSSPPVHNLSRPPSSSNAYIASMEYSGYKQYELARDRSLSRSGSRGGLDYYLGGGRLSRVDSYVNDLHRPYDYSVPAAYETYRSSSRTRYPLGGYSNMYSSYSERPAVRPLNVSGMYEERVDSLQRSLSRERANRSRLQDEHLRLSRKLEEACRQMDLLRSSSYANIRNGSLARSSIFGHFYPYY